MALKLKDIGDIGNVIAALGVIVSLLVVAWEIRRNTNAVQAEARLQIVQLQRQNLDWNRDPRLVDIMNRGSNNLDSLNAIERQQFLASTIGILDAWEQGYFLYRDGLIDDDYWNGWNRGFASYLSLVGRRAIWELTKGAYSSEFRTFVDGQFGQE